MDIVLIVAAVLLFWEFIVFGVLNALAQSALYRGDRTAELRFRRLLLRVPGLPIWSPHLKVTCRFRIAAMLMEQKRYAEAADECRAILANPHLPASTTANVHRRLADCLEATGDIDQSEDQRQVASKALREATPSPDVLISKGDEARQARHSDTAIEAYQQALDLVPQDKHEIRASVLAKLSIAFQQAGQTEAMIRAAEQATELPANPIVLQSAYSLAGIGHQTAGRLDTAEARFNSALEVARKSGNAKMVGARMAQLALVQKLRGRLLEGLETCRQAKGDFEPSDMRLILMAEASCYRFMGEFDKAVGILDRSLSSGHYIRPEAERRAVGVASLEAAWILAESERPDMAWDKLQGADEFLKDKRLAGTWEASAAWILALQGQKDVARTKIAEVRRVMEESSNDRRTVQNLAALLGRASVALGDWEDGLALWERYLDTEPEPLFLPLGQYFRGRCLQGLDRVEDARGAWQTAIASDIPSFHVKEARRAMDGLAGRT